MSGIVNHYLPLIQDSKSTAQRFSSSNKRQSEVV
jgi:hypothetical protein